MHNSTTNCSRLSLIAVSGLIFGLSACGGGVDNKPSSPPATSVTITAANSQQVAGAAIDTTTGSGGYFALMSAPAASASAPSAVSTAQTVAQIGREAIERAVAASAASEAVPNATATYNCVGGGTESVTFTSTTAGSITFNNCVYATGLMENGTISFSNYFSTTSLFSVDYVYNVAIAFSTPYPTNTLTMSGDMRINDNRTNTTMSGSSLAMNNTGTGLVNFTVWNYSMTYSDANGHNLAMTYIYDAPGGTATFTMISPFFNTGGLFPSSGAATISGASSTVLKLTVLGDESAPVGSQVKLELSSDGGATYGVPTYVTWASISSLI